MTTFGVFSTWVGGYMATGVIDGLCDQYSVKESNSRSSFLLTRLTFPERSEKS